MKKKDKVSFIVNTLESLYGEPEIPLKHKDPYTLLIAVLLSAQCTDERVNKVTPKLFTLADNPITMSNLPVSKIQEIIRPCGLSQTKSKAISTLSKKLVKYHDNKVPNSLEKLEAFPGVGHKTASVVLAQAFGISTFPVDTHIHRLSYRWCISTGKSVKKTEEDCKKFYPKNLWNKLHLQIIYFGREFCPARAHNPNKCPICKIIGRKSMFK